MVAGLAGLAGCAYTPAPIPEDLAGFDRQLASEYDRLALAEFDENDWSDGRLFAAKAEAARAGQTPGPDDLAERAYPAALRAELEAGRDRLTAVLGGTARLTAPGALARAQGAFDCLAQEAEERLQPQEIAQCREAFEQFLAEAEAAGAQVIVVLLEPDEDTAVVVRQAASEVMLDTAFEGIAGTSGSATAFAEADVLREIEGALAVEPERQRSYLVNFDTGAVAITEASRPAFDAALADAAETEAVAVTVFGHTDRQGPARVNVRIARERAETVRDLLIEAGLDPLRVEADSFGESFPLVPTPDGAAEPRNRRVEIVVR